MTSRNASAPRRTTPTKRLLWLGILCWTACDRGFDVEQRAAGSDAGDMAALADAGGSSAAPEATTGSTPDASPDGGRAEGAPEQPRQPDPEGDGGTESEGEEETGSQSLAQTDPEPESAEEPQGEPESSVETESEPKSPEESPGEPETPSHPDPELASPTDPDPPEPETTAPVPDLDDEALAACAAGLVTTLDWSNGVVEVGPGCVKFDDVRVPNDATLTIAAGTTVLMTEGSLLSASSRGTNSSTGSIEAVGTADAPIILRSAKLVPQPGDWDCLYISDASARTELRHVVVRHAGAGCSNTGDPTAALIGSPARVTHLRVEQSLTHGLMLERFDKKLLELDHLSFGDNGGASLLIPNNRLAELGENLHFDDPGDAIEITGGTPSDTERHYRNYGVAYHVGDYSLGSSVERAIIDAGVVFRIAGGGGIDFYKAEVQMLGTPEAPILFTSQYADPRAGDWGCLRFAAGVENIELSNVIIEHAGSGQCTGNDQAAISTDSLLNVESLLVRDTYGAAILAGIDCESNANLGAQCCAQTRVESLEGPGPAIICDDDVDFCAVQ